MKFTTKATHMYKLNKTGLKGLKTIHLICACCWCGGALALFVINLSQSQADSQPMLHGMILSAHLVDFWIIVIPGANGCLVTGLIYGLFTNWGFFKHRWIAVKWLLTISAMLSGTFLLGVWEGQLLELSADTNGTSLLDPEYARIMAKHMTMACIQIAMLVFMIWLSVFKPWKPTSSNKQPQRAKHEQE